jgi:hypothetical protein
LDVGRWTFFNFFNVQRSTFNVQRPMSGGNTQHIARVKRAAALADANIAPDVLLLQETRYKLANMREAARHIAATPHTKDKLEDFKSLLALAVNLLNEIEV